jgi:hypothetical protein
MAKANFLKESYRHNLDVTYANWYKIAKKGKAHNEKWKRYLESIPYEPHFKELPEETKHQIIELLA